MKRRGVLLAATGGLTLLGGCASGPAVWAWPPAADLSGYPAARSPAITDRQQPDTGRTDAGVLVFPHSAFVADDAQAAMRRDSVLAARTPEALPDRLGWPQESRPDLRRTGTLRTSTQAERWVYPETRRDQGYRRYHVYPPHRSW